MNPTPETNSSRIPTRRRFILLAAAGAVALGVSAWGFNRASAVNRTAQSTSVVIPAIERMRDRLDATMASGGPAAIRATLQGADMKTTYVTFIWIADRHHAALYPDIVAGFSDTRLQIRMATINALWFVPRPALKPSLPTLSAYLATESDPSIATELGDLITAVSKS